MSPLLVDDVQRAAEERAVVVRETQAESGDHFVSRAVRVLCAPGRDPLARPALNRRRVLAETHRAPLAARPQPTLALDLAARFMADASLTIAYQRGGLSQSEAVEAGK
jgi:hypothetical protein